MSTTYRGRKRPTPIESRPTRSRELRAARIAVGLTQKELGALAGVDQSNIAHYETGGATFSDEMLAFLLGVILRAPR